MFSSCFNLWARLRRSTQATYWSKVVLMLFQPLRFSLFTVGICLWLGDYFHSSEGLQFCPMLVTGIWDISSLVTPKRMQPWACAQSSRPAERNLILSLAS